MFTNSKPFKCWSELALPNIPQKNHRLIIFQNKDGSQRLGILKSINKDGTFTVIESNSTKNIK